VGAETFRENLTLQGILTRGEMGEPPQGEAFTLWTYDEQEYGVIFEDHREVSDLAATLPTKVEIQGKCGLDRNGRKTVTVRKYKLIK
jgi:hypothetical protein